MPSLTLSSASIDFLDQELWQRIYTTEKAFPTARRVKLIDKNTFTAAALDLKYETYVVYVGSVNSVALLSSSPLELDFHPSRRLQISGLIAKKTPTKIFDEYVDFADVFFSDLTSKLFDHIRINNNAIKLVDGQQLPYGPIYSLEPIKLEILKAYSETNLANKFI